MLKRLSMLLLLVALCAPAQARVDQISYMKNGVYSGKIGTYTLGGASYLDASEAAKLIGGKIYWYPVSGKLLLQIKGKRVVFFLKSDSITINDEKVEYPNPMIVRGGKAFLALSFFVSGHFSEAFGFSLEYNKDAGTLAAQRAVNITSVNYFSHADKTRIVVYMEEPLEWQSSQKENNLFKVNIFGGVIAREEKLSIGDGVLKGADLLQENKTARLVLDPDDNFGEVKVFSLSDPDRLVIDVSKKIAPVQQSIAGAPPAGASPPAALAGDADTAAAAAGAPAAAAAVAASITPVISPSGAGEAAPAQPSQPLQPSVLPAIPDKIEVGAGKKRVVIDAGHGGKDPGGRKLFGLKEKDLNLYVAQDLYKLMKADDMYDVLMTRNSDEFIPLADRSVIANNFKADIFISIHANASSDRREKGFEIYFMSEKASDPWAAQVADYENSVVGMEDGGGQQDPAAMLLHSMARNEYLNEGSKLAGFVGAEMENRTPFRNRGVKQAAFYVLRGTYAPGILVEMGFMTNSNDQKNMNSGKVREKIASAIYRGVQDYAKKKGWK